MRSLIRVLFVAVFAMGFLAADASEALGLGGARMVLAALLVLALTVLPLAADRGVEVGHLALPLGLGLLLAAIAALDVPSGIDPLEYKILLLLPPMLAAPAIARRVPAADLPETVHALLACYVIVSALLVLAGDPASMTKGVEGAPRLDPTGSVIAHASFCLIYLLTAAAGFAQAGRLGRAVRLGVGVLAFAMLLATASRTPFIVLFVYVGLRLLALGRDGRTLRIALAVAVAVLAVATLWTFTVSDAVWLRLAGAGQDDYSTGRAASIRQWLLLSADGPLGLGGVRAMLADEKPILADGTTLEWPHNELVRFWVEAGPLGLAFVATLLIAAWRRGIAAARASTDPAMVALVLAVTADLSIQLVLQNGLNAIYQATAYVLLLWVASAGVAQAQPELAALPSKALRRAA